MPPSHFQDIKLWIIHLVGLERDALHIYVGMGLYLFALFIKRHDRHRYFWAVALVFSFACLGEAIDRYDNLVDSGHWLIKASIHDIINTCFFPVILTICHRCGLFDTTKTSAKD